MKAGYKLDITALDLDTIRRLRPRASFSKTGEGGPILTTIMIQPIADGGRLSNQERLEERRGEYTLECLSSTAYAKTALSIGSYGLGRRELQARTQAQPAHRPNRR